MTHRNVGILIWAALIILLLIGLLFPPIPNRISTELGAAGWLSGSLFSLGALSAGLSPAASSLPVCSPWVSSPSASFR